MDDSHHLTFQVKSHLGIARLHKQSMGSHLIRLTLNHGICGTSREGHLSPAVPFSITSGFQLELQIFSCSFSLHLCYIAKKITF